MGNIEKRWYFLLFSNRRTTSGPAITREYTEDGLVHDGAPCGKNLVCVNQTCVSIFPYIDQTKCPTDGNNVECYGQGVSQFDSFILVFHLDCTINISIIIKIINRILNLGVHKYKSLFLWYRFCWTRLRHCCAGNDSSTNWSGTHRRQYH